jgi:hypothetical protein
MRDTRLSADLRQASALIAADPDDCGWLTPRCGNLAVLGSWDELIDQVGRRPGMFVGRARYALVRSYVEGFGAARNDDVLDRHNAASGFGRFATPEDVGWAVRFLASEEAGYITGQTQIVDGGQVLPESGD